MNPHSSPKLRRPRISHRLCGLLLVCLAWPSTSWSQASRVALIQYDADARFGATLDNLERLAELATEAVERGAQLIVLPEGSTHGYASADEAWCSPERSRCGAWSCRDVRGVAERAADGPTTRFWADFAARHAAYVVYSIIESDGGAYFNSAAVVGPQGFVTSYRKRLLYGPDYCYAQPGRQMSSFSTPFGRFGLMICADGNSHEYFQAYRRQGIEAIILPMDWDQDPASDRAAKEIFQQMAGANAVAIYVADNARWDGTGYYPAGRNAARPRRLGGRRRRRRRSRLRRLRAMALAEASGRSTEPATLCSAASEALKSRDSQQDSRTAPGYSPASLPPPPALPAVSLLVATPAAVSHDLIETPKRRRRHRYLNHRAN